MPDDVTGGGGGGGADGAELLPLLYDELRALAARKMADDGEIAALLGVNEKTVRRHWTVAKVWLYEAMSEE